MIEIKNDITLDVAVANTRYARTWRNVRMQWSEIVRRCGEARRTGETVAEYARMSREEQSQVKDVGGFVGGYLSGGKRKTEAVMYRTIVTLDIDYGTPDVWDDFTSQYSCAGCMYSTHKHTPEKPRLRLLIPLSRNVSRDEYEPLCRRIAEAVGINLFDITTYELARLFYWPSTSRDGEFVFEYQDGPPLDADKILSTYVDYKDASAWPVSSREPDNVRREIKKAGDPTEKNGLIGAFCRAYTIEDAIEELLADAYEPTATEGRYTYRKGSVAGGLVCYDHKFAYSHHETDPAGRQLCNAFDLCRIHLFGELDEDSRVTEVTRLPSYRKMADMAANDGKVKMLIAREHLASAEADFGDIDADGADSVAGVDWTRDLEVDGKGLFKNSAKNIMLIMENDPRLKGHLWLNEFSGFDMVRGGLPWDKNATIWSNRDDANLRVFLENNYKITGKDKIKDAKEAVLTMHKIHPIRDYLKGLTWDGIPRLERLVIDLIGAPDTELVRTMTRKWFVGAVARVMRPGCKFDYCLILMGPEGIGKSTLFSLMAGEWFSDSVTTMEGKGGMEQLRNAWIIELSELSALKRSEVEQTKAFISRQEDRYRPAYGTVIETYKRQCVFCGTTNEQYFLKGDAGNRRFWVIPTDPSLSKCKDLRAELEAIRDQLWAEAVEIWRKGEKLYLSPELEAEARQVQTEVNDNADNPMKEMLEAFLEKKIPADWYNTDLQQRRAYMQKSVDPTDAEAVAKRDRVCAVEFLYEGLGMDRFSGDLRYKSREVNRMLEELGWIGNKRLEIGGYGKQRCFVRPYKIDDDEDDDI